MSTKTELETKENIFVLNPKCEIHPVFLDHKNSLDPIGRMHKYFMEDINRYLTLFNTPFKMFSRRLQVSMNYVAKYVSEEAGVK